MSLEQAILLVVFVLIPLAQAIAGARKRRHTSARRTDVPPAPTGTETELDEWLANASQGRVAAPPLFSAQVREPTPKAPVRAAPVPRPARQAPADKLRAQRLRTLPSSREGLRDAFALSIILGPPRALERGER